ncbi:DUF4249 domain-containing protein [Adhaeribacter soli]|uniref:DUF4249 domain-containing protein n=1 Tax=Adhaeribacter soli TaxID=2607655 RepID=A0A5N1J5D6_9BACT|nr:DUF4249 domain-containing protein [Adhaeribacter soli]KAA9340289.1 DUF4249 domain-containing protein [Adhaeribacter soli]
MHKIYLILVLVILGGCIEPVDVPIEKQERLLMVDGLITDEPGPYIVKLNKSFYYGEYFGDAHPDVKNAIVTIFDDQGTIEVLSETFPGKYETNKNGIRGRIGGSYQLKIRLKNGQEYISEPEVLKPVPAIDKLYTTFAQEHSLNEQNETIITDVVRVLVDAKDPANEKNYYRWSSEGTYQVFTQPEDYMEKVRDVLVPRPKSCCPDCWLTDKNNLINVNDDRQFNGKTLVGQPILQVPATPRFFDIKYRVEVAQYSLSETAFNFWETIKLQSKGTGSVQDPAPANAVSNIKNISNGAEKVIGYFGASAVARKALFITKQDIPIQIPKFIYPDDCRTMPLSTTERPAFWQ